MTVSHQGPEPERQNYLAYATAGEVWAEVRTAAISWVILSGLMIGGGYLFS